MRSVTVRKDDLIARLRENRDNHRGLFEAALDGYQHRLIGELERRLHDVRRGRRIDQYIRLPEPEDHTTDYDRVIAMAEMSVDEHFRRARGGDLMPTGPKHQRFIPDDDDPNTGYTEDCRCTIGEDHDADGRSAEALDVHEAADIWRSNGMDEDYTFGFSESELRRAADDD